MSNKHQLLRRIIQTELNEYALLLIDRGASSDDVLNVLSTKPTWILKSYDDQEMQRLSKKLAAAISENQSTDDQSQREFIRHVDAVLRELCDGV